MCVYKCFVVVVLFYYNMMSAHLAVKLCGRSFVFEIVRSNQASVF